MPCANKPWDIRKSLWKHKKGKKERNMFVKDAFLWVSLLGLIYENQKANLIMSSYLLIWDYINISLLIYKIWLNLLNSEIILKEDVRASCPASDAKSVSTAACAMIILWLINWQASGSLGDQYFYINILICSGITFPISSSNCFINAYTVCNWLFIV